MFKFVIRHLSLLLALYLPSTALAGSNHSIILSYQKISEPLNQDANLSFNQFESHIEYLLKEEYNIIPLSWLVKSINAGKTIPDKSVVIVFEGGFQSPLEQALPLLNKHKLPYTIFIAPRTVDQNAPSTLDWPSIKKLSKLDHVTIGLHPEYYTHIVHNEAQNISHAINTAIVRYREELGKNAQYFAYPYGEISHDFKLIIDNAGFEAALGQQSGPAWKGSDPLALPRFTITEKYGSIERLQMNLNTLPIIVHGIEPQDTKLETTEPAIGFTIQNLSPEQIKNINCFGSSLGKLNKQIIGENRIEIRLPSPITEERFRLNCTLAKPRTQSDEHQKWYWHGMLFNISEDSLY